MSAPSVRAELANAVRAVNAAYDHLPADAQAAIDIAYDGLDGEVDAAVLADDQPRALAAIRAWGHYWLDRFERAAR